MARFKRSSSSARRPGIETTKVHWRVAKPVEPVDTSSNEKQLVLWIEQESTLLHRRFISCSVEQAFPARTRLRARPRDLGSFGISSQSPPQFKLKSRSGHAQIKLGTALLARILPGHTARARERLFRYQTILNLKYWDARGEKGMRRKHRNKWITWTIRTTWRRARDAGIGPGVTPSQVVEG